MHTAKLRSNEAIKSYIDIHQNKNRITHAARCCTLCHIFSKHSIHLYAPEATASTSLYFQVPTALSLLLVLLFYELMWNLSIKSKSIRAKSILMLLAHCKQIIKNQRKTVRSAIAINVCWRKSSCKHFPLATSHAKVANSGSATMMIARYLGLPTIPEWPRESRNWRLASRVPGWVTFCSGSCWSIFVLARVHWLLYFRKLRLIYLWKLNSP